MSSSRFFPTCLDALPRQLKIEAESVVKLVRPAGHSARTPNHGARVTGLSR